MAEITASAQTIATAPVVGVARLPPETRSSPGRAGVAIVSLAAGAGLALFFISLRGIDLSQMNGLGLLSVLPVGVIAGVLLIALAFVLGLTLPKANPAILGAVLVSLVICLDGITIFVEPEPRFPTAYQIAGFVDYVSRTGHTAPSLAGYFSWPGFFELISFVTGVAGTHSLLTLMKVWPMAIDLLCLPPLFLIMRNLRVSWRAQWLAAFLFTVGNWVGQDYFSPQSFDYLLYLVFVAILVNWFADPDRSRPLRIIQASRLARLHRRIFGPLRPGELPPRPAKVGQRAFLLALLIAIFTVSTASHQLTPFFMIGACAGLVLIRRCTLPGLPILFGVILAGYVSFATVDYWSGHLSNVLGGIGHLGLNVTTSVGGRLTGSSPTHLLALHARVLVALVIVGLAGLGLLRRRRQGMDDRVLLTLFVMPFLLIGVVSYGGEIALRTYLFLLPAACLLGALFFFPHPQSETSWRSVTALVGCALVLPVGFILARYGNEAFERVPPGELAASNWVYAHDAHGVRLLWLSTAPATDVTPEMPWSYRDLTKVEYVPTLAPRDPASVGGLVSALRAAGPGSYLIATRTQVVAMQQTASYTDNWGTRFRADMSAAPDVRIAFATKTAVIYTLHWPPGARPMPLPTSGAGTASHRFAWTGAGLIVLWLLLALLAASEFIRLWRPSTGVIKLLWLASGPLFLLLAADVVLRFVVLS
jgi:hypothetical protein